MKNDEIKLFIAKIRSEFKEQLIDEHDGKLMLQKFDIAVSFAAIEMLKGYFKK